MDSRYRLLSKFKLTAGIKCDTMVLVKRMNDIENYIEQIYTCPELEDIFIKEFTQVRKENNLTQALLGIYSGVSREKIARIESKMHSPSINALIKILGPIGYTIKIEKVSKNGKKY